MQKMQKIFALALMALFSGAFAQAAGEVELNVVYRDFSSDEYGFQEYDQFKGNNRRCAEVPSDGPGKDKTNQSNMDNPRNRICFSNGTYHACNVGNGTAVRYGEDNGCQRPNTKRGYTNVASTAPGALYPINNNICWDQLVIVTRDMVEERLDYSQCGKDTDTYPMNNWQGADSDPEYLRGMTCARPLPKSGKPLNEVCYGDHLDVWFTSGGRAKTIDELTLPLKSKAGSAVYEIEYNYNVRTPEWNDNGFFPLDKFATDGYKTYGKQNRNAWNEQSGSDGCTRGQSCSDNNDGKAHNYGFSMAGSGMFKYNSTASAGDVFEFVGDDDMWIFVDGKLFEDKTTGAHGDLGGNHLAAPAMINISSYARQENWPEDSWHVINFFYMERQTDGSNLKISMKLNELAPALNSFPRIIKAETKVDSDGGVKTLLYVSSQLDMGSINAFVTGGTSYGWPVVVQTSDGAIRGYVIESIGGERRGEGGYIYDIVGYICDDTSCNSKSVLNSGDYLSFNTINSLFEDKNLNPGGFALNDESKYIKNRAGKPADISWGLNTTTRLKDEFTPEKPDVGVVKPDNPSLQPGTGSPTAPDKSVPGGAGGPINGSGGQITPGNGNLPGITTIINDKGEPVSYQSFIGDDKNGAKDNNAIHGFGEIGKPIPPQRAGELILTAFPSAIDDGWYQNTFLPAYKGKEDTYEFFGLPPQAQDAGSGEWWGLTDPTATAAGSQYGNAKYIGPGGNQFVKNGFPNESSVKGNIKVAPTRCTATINESAPKGQKASINCLSFNMVAEQPFTLAVTVYDQLGNFVTQYRETVSPEEFRYATQAPGYFGNVNWPRERITEDGTSCEIPTTSNYGSKNTMTVNGQLNVSVNVYPFSSTGRRFGNGVYIVKVDKVDIPFEGCQIVGGQATWMTPKFERAHSEMKFGWLRTKD